MTSLRGGASVMLALMVLAVLFAACASEPKDPDQLRAEACADLCAQIEALPCRDEYPDNHNPLVFLVDPIEGCETECGRSNLIPSACQAARDEFLLCAANRGLECASGPGEPFTVPGCDDEAIQLGEACGSCVAMPSGDSHACLSQSDQFFSCSRTSTQWMGYGSPFCYSTCSEEPEGSNQYCCEEYWQSTTACKPDAGPICEGCN